VILETDAELVYKQYLYNRQYYLVVVVAASS